MKLSKTLFISDTHIPFEDKNVCRLLLQLLEKEHFDMIVHLGDLTDMYAISRFNKEKERLIGLKNELAQGQAFLSAITKRAPKSRKVLLEGNHEHRIHKLLTSLSGELAELANLPTVTNALNWKVLLNLPALKWEFVKYDQQPVSNLLPILVKHGNIVRANSGYSAKSELDKAGSSVIMGHTHRLGIIHQHVFGRDLIGIENGCLCDLDAPYIQGFEANWQHGFTIIEHDTKKIWNVEQIHITNNTFYYNGRIYK